MKTSFENLFVWQEARELVKLIYRIMEVCRDWGDSAVAPRSEVWLICVRIYESAVQKMQRTFGANHE